MFFEYFRGISYFFDSLFLLQHPSNIQDIFNFQGFLLTAETSDILQYSWSSSNAIQKAFYKVCIVMDLPSEPSTSEHNQQNVHAQEQLQHGIPAPVPFLLAPPANPLPNNQQNPFSIAGSSCNIVPSANPLTNNQQDPLLLLDHHII
ncbi:hypothetical protein BU17DRAFT_63947 [Hysterangium stoloniferum]|nr:hypothetical protein BU17DRAFT_63947 [Hysterangium stoloniferum]